MLLTHTTNFQPFTLIAHPSEPTPEPKDISRRMLQVRASWDLRERIARKRAARSRFASLVRLLGVHADPPAASGPVASGPCANESTR